jgi:peptidoglycan hydrolase-like protein with peptidoglycan-binding domain
VMLLYGRQPAWRAFAPGIPDGPDVAELEANLAALGFARGLIRTPDGHFDWATRAAVQRWQHAMRLALTGAVELGRVVFLPGAVRVGAHQAAVGTIASPGAAPYTATSSTRVVTVALDADRQGEAHPGAKVTIDLPEGRTTTGTITDVSRVATLPSVNADASASGGDSAQPTVAVTAVPEHPAATGRLDQEPVQVELVTDTRRGVLAVPISALLALAEGGYGLEVVEPTGVHRLVAVNTGLFATTMVEVSGPDLAEGTRVVTAQ